MISRPAFTRKVLVLSILLLCTSTICTGDITKDQPTLPADTATVETSVVTPTGGQTPTRDMASQTLKVPETTTPTRALTATSSAAPTPPSLYSRLPVVPRFVEEEGETRVYFSENYKELPEAEGADRNVKPDMIIIHTDGQSIDLPDQWSTLSTYYGLGKYLSVHFAVSQDGILQMLPMYAETVTHASGAASQYDDNGNWITYNNHSVQIEMAGRKYNYYVTGEASPKMAEVIEITTEKTVDLVISLMYFYDIPLENVVGHYQIGRGKADPGDLYFEQYFLPLLEKKLTSFQGSLEN
ncbi:MAG: N-acetylmuramoyl-L-alanine amidase [Anaerolineaceae bacterium]